MKVYEWVIVILAIAWVLKIVAWGLNGYANRIAEARKQLEREQAKREGEGYIKAAEVIHENFLFQMELAKQLRARKKRRRGEQGEG